MENKRWWKEKRKTKNTGGCVERSGKGSRDGQKMKEDQKMETGHQEGGKELVMWPPPCKRLREEDQ